MAAADLLTPRAATTARQLELLARTRVEGFLKSVNASKMKGQSTDFLRHRQYQYGDDLRHLDWRVFARSDRLVTRQYEETTNLDGILCLDVSASMGYGGESMSKLEYARRLTAMLGYVLHLQRDRFGLVGMHTRISGLVKPGSGKSHLAEAFRQLAGFEPGGETNLDACIRQLIAHVPRRSLFIVLSDCYQDPDAFTKALGSLRLRGHDVMLYQVFEPTEEELPFAGFTLFRDLETGQIDAADPLEIRDAYRAVAERHTRSLQAGCTRFGIEYERLPVSADWINALAQVLHVRSRRA